MTLGWVLACSYSPRGGEYGIHPSKTFPRGLARGGMIRLGIDWYITHMFQSRDFQWILIIHSNIEGRYTIYMVYYLYWKLHTYLKVITHSSKYWLNYFLLYHNKQVTTRSRPRPRGPNPGFIYLNIVDCRSRN